MIYPDFKEFKKLAKKGNVIPVYREILADLETPVSAFLKIDDGLYAYLLESVEGQEHVGRYSFLACGPAFVFETKNRTVTCTRFSKGRNLSRSFACVGNPLDELKKMLRDFHYVAVKGLPRFCGGFVGYVGYDMVRFFEEIPDKNVDDLQVPDCVMMLSQTLLVFDHANRKIKIVSNVILDEKTPAALASAYRRALSGIDALAKKLEKPLRADAEPKRPLREPVVASNMTKAAFMKGVRKAKEYIQRGDIIQTVLSQRFHMKLHNKPFNIYRSLRGVNPSPYMFYLKLSDVTLVGSSPELLVRCENGVVETRPIAGTRPRGTTEQDDERLVKELLADPKEKAEHLMLVDLGRNDLGRVCDYGSVKVNEFMAVEKYSHVMHIVSNVTGKLQKARTALDALAACFPAGTVSGAPKIRAMEIIDEIETTRRGPYAGAVCYFSFSGNLDSCIIIRTMMIKDNTLYIQAGAGIVSDSDPAKEYQETVNKARALFEAATYVF
ncbi:MAG: anthranilate synthase component I [Candidatus Omnitrophica bacterium]|nr:anthranilate synthase component I [Candidatus Omnitrophota bacterium]